MPHCLAAKFDSTRKHYYRMLALIAGSIVLNGDER
jgi:hypothetical protein